MVLKVIIDHSTTWLTDGLIGTGTVFDHRAFSTSTFNVRKDLASASSRNSGLNNFINLGSQSDNDSSVITFVPFPCLSNLQMCAARIPIDLPDQPIDSFSTTSCNTEVMFTPMAFHWKAVPGRNSPSSLANVTSFCHFGQFSMSVCISHTRSIGASMRISRLPVNGAFESMFIVDIISKTLFILANRLELKMWPVKQGLADSLFPHSGKTVRLCNISI